MEIREYLEKNLDNLKSDLSRLVKIPSVSTDREGEYPFGRECGRVLDEFLQIAEERGFTVKNLDYYAGSADLYPEGDALLGILAHLDVVPVTEKSWSVPPFEMTEKEGRLYGRGVEDDKGPLLAAMWAMKAVKECGFKLKGNVRLIAGCSEETGTELDLREYCKREKMPKKVFTPDAEFPLITTEKGMLRFTFGGRTLTEKIIGIKGGTVVNAVPDRVTAILRGKISLSPEEGITSYNEDGNTVIVCGGKSAHASTPAQGENAFTKLFKYLSAIEELTEGDRKLTESLLKLFPHGETNAAALDLAVEDRSGETTCVFSIIDLREGQLTAKADMRFPVSLNKARCSEKIKAAVEGAGFELLNITGSEPHSVDENSEFVRALLAAYAEVTGKPAFCKAIGGGTYVHNIEGGVAFGMEVEGEDNHIHGDDEWVGVDTLLTAAEIYAKAILGILGE